MNPLALSQTCLMHGHIGLAQPRAGADLTHRRRTVPCAPRAHRSREASASPRNLLALSDGLNPEDTELGLAFHGTSHRLPAVPRAILYPDSASPSRHA